MQLLPLYCIAAALLLPLYCITAAALLQRLHA